MNGTVVVSVQATGSLRSLIPPDTTVADVKTIGEAVGKLALPETGELLLLLNGQMAYWQTEVADGDVIKLVPAMSGG